MVFLDSYSNDKNLLAEIFVFYWSNFILSCSKSHYLSYFLLLLISWLYQCCLITHNLNNQNPSLVQNTCMGSDSKTGLENWVCAKTHQNKENVFRLCSSVDIVRLREVNIWCVSYYSKLYFHLLSLPSPLFPCLENSKYILP